MVSLRPILGLLIGVLACTPAPVTPAPPAAPVLEGDGAMLYDHRWTLKGTAPDDTVVRVYLDGECRGPALRDVTSAELAEGVPLELVAAIPNVFAAVSIDSGGLTSPCSAPVRVSFERPLRPRLQDVNLRPQLPTRETHFVISGEVVDAVSVQLFEDNCLGAPLGELSPAAFSEVGFSIDLQPNQSRTFMVQARNVIQETSPCSSPLLAVSDWQPPLVRPAILSPMPSPERRAFVSISSEAAFGNTFLGSDCTGPMLTSCSSADCHAFRLEFPMAAMSSWSASAVDSLGNTSGCVNAPMSWAWDPLAPPPAIELRSSASSQFVYGSVPASAEWVELFDGPVCGDPERLRARIMGRWLLTGYYLANFNVPSDGGVIVAQGLSLDMTAIVSPCSQPAPWY